MAKRENKGGKPKGIEVSKPLPITPPKKKGK